jgi:hypothetical protein
MTKTNLVYLTGLSGCVTVNDTRSYVWIVEDTLASGSFRDYVDSIKNAHYGGHYVSAWLWQLDGTELRRVEPKRKQSEWDSNDYASVTYTLNGETFGYSVDGRA